MATGIILFAHGSSVPSANDAVRKVADRVGAQAAFLEGGQPNLAEAASLLVGEGVSRIIVVPYFLTLGLHLQRDLPPMIQSIAKSHPGLELHVTEPLDGHPALTEIVLDRIKDT